MPRLLHVGTHPGSVYESGVQSAWKAGEVRDVTEEQAAYLLGTFGGRFTTLADPPSSVEPEPPIRTAGPFRPSRHRGSLGK